MAVSAEPTVVYSHGKVVAVYVDGKMHTVGIGNHSTEALEAELERRKPDIQEMAAMVTKVWEFYQHATAEQFTAVNGLTGLTMSMSSDCGALWNTLTISIEEG